MGFTEWGTAYVLTISKSPHLIFHRMAVFELSGMISSVTRQSIQAISPRCTIFRYNIWRNFVHGTACVYSFKTQSSDSSRSELFGGESSLSIKEEKSFAHHSCDFAWMRGFLPSSWKVQSPRKVSFPNLRAIANTSLMYRIRSTIPFSKIT